MKATNLIVFRENSTTVSGRELGQQLVEATTRARDRESVLNGLLVAGVAECALADCGSPEQRIAQSPTDGFAELLVRGAAQNGKHLASLADRVANGLPETVRVSPPEGFAYYALHPLDFAEGACVDGPEGSFAVIGIRTIGTVLSAMTLAGLQKRGIAASRTTVRPEGHPYDRHAQFRPYQLDWIRQHKRRGSRFLVVDEGPGLSGSSFLSVGEALTACSVAGDRITFLGTRDVEPAQLCSRDAASRWERFKFRRAHCSIGEKFNAVTSLGTGEWRRHLLSSQGEWPGSWTQMERLKFLDPDCRHVLKFDGLGYLGEQVRERARAICEAGFGPGVESAGDGMSAYAFISGSPLSRSDCSREVLDRLAQYCAFRFSVFRVDNADGRHLGEMARHNFEQEFGKQLALPSASLETSIPVLADARMQPYEWVRSRDGKILKVDACSHGDDHFQPGPTDIAWDLAGAIVEWALDEDSESYFVQKYWEHTGDDPRVRLPQFVLAYGIYRMAYVKMALNATHEQAERSRLERSYRFYRSRVGAASRVFGACA